MRDKPLTARLNSATQNREREGGREKARAPRSIPLSHERKYYNMQISSPTFSSFKTRNSRWQIFNVTAAGYISRRGQYPLYRDNGLDEDKGAFTGRENCAKCVWSAARECVYYDGKIINEEMKTLLRIQLSPCDATFDCDIIANAAILIHNRKNFFTARNGRETSQVDLGLRLPMAILPCFLVDTIRRVGSSS